MTTRIELITTGKCEQLALGTSLARVFADADVRFENHHKGLLNSFTSRQLTYPVPADRRIPTEIDKAVDALVEAAISRKDPADFVFLIDDLELVNMDTPEIVVNLLRDAVERVSHDATHRNVEKLRDRCSVHFLCPMLEAYFYGEPAAVVRAGAKHSAILNGGRSLEAFQSADLAFLGFSDVQRHPWRKPSRWRHPKAYLQFLNDPEDSGNRAIQYKESKHGRAALETLDWEQVFARPPAELAFARSLFDDLADAMGVETPFPGACHPLTQRRSDGVLRNL